MMRSSQLIQSMIWLAFMGPAFTAQAQLTFGENRFSFDGTALYQDAKDPLHYYYLPSYLSLAQNEKGAFDLYFESHLAEKENEGGAFLHMIVDFQLPEVVVARWEGQLQQMQTGARIAGPAPIVETLGEEGTAHFQLLLSEFTDSGVVQTELSSGTATILPGNKASISARLGAKEAVMFKEAWSYSKAEVSVALQAYYPAAVKGYPAVVEGEFAQIYERFSERSLGPTYLDFRQIREWVEEMILQGGLRISTYSDKLTTDEFVAILDITTYKLIEELFSHRAAWSRLPNMEVAIDAVSQIEQLQAGLFTKRFQGVGQVEYRSASTFGLNLKRYDKIKAGRFYLNLQNPGILKMPVYCTGSMSGPFFEALSQSEQYFKSTNLNDPLFAAREVLFQIDGAYVESFRDIFNFVSVEVKKDYPDQTIREEIIFTRRDLEEGKDFQISSYPRFGSGDADWLDYEYRVNWSLKGTGQTIEMPWIATNAPAVSLTPPIEQRHIFIESDRRAFEQLGLRASTVKFTVSLNGASTRQKQLLFRKEDTENLKQLTLYHDPGEPVLYETAWILENQPPKIDSLKELTTDFLSLQPPVLRDATSGLAFADVNAPGQPDALHFERNNKDVALFFAVNDYEQDTIYPSLKHPIANLQAISEELENRFGFQAELVENPGRAMIKNKLEEYARKYEEGVLDPEGQLLIFFSGHGEFDRGNGFFLPADANKDDLEATSITYSVWQPRIDRISCRHIFVIIDACFSGTFDPEIAMRSGEKRFGRPNELSNAERFYQDHLKRTTRLFLSSGAKEQTPDDSGFAKRLLEGFRVASRGQGFLTAGQLYELFVKNARPTPILGTFGQNEPGSSFLFFTQD